MNTRAITLISLLGTSGLVSKADDHPDSGLGTRITGANTDGVLDSASDVDRFHFDVRTPGR